MRRMNKETYYLVMEDFGRIYSINSNGYWEKDEFLRDKAEYYIPRMVKDIQERLYPHIEWNEPKFEDILQFENNGLEEMFDGIRQNLNEKSEIVLRFVRNNKNKKNDDYHNIKDMMVRYINDTEEVNFCHARDRDYICFEYTYDVLLDFVKEDYNKNYRNK